MAPSQWSCAYRNFICLFFTNEFGHHFKSFEGNVLVSPISSVEGSVQYFTPTYITRRRVPASVWISCFKVKWYNDIRDFRRPSAYGHTFIFHATQGSRAQVRWHIVGHLKYKYLKCRCHRYMAATFVSTVSADVLAPNGARPSAGTVLTTRC